MKDNKYKIQSNVCIAEDTFEMTLLGDTRDITAPGQFINITVDGGYLRRPISICKYTPAENGSVTVIYKVVGKGTETLSAMKEGDTLSALVSLGNGYDLESIPDDALLIGGGVGVPPMYGLASALVKAGKHPRMILGFNEEKEVFYTEAFEELLGSDAVSLKVGGYVTDGVDMQEYICACGPEPMLRAVTEKAKDGQFSFATRMGCGFGACMGCTCKTKYGNKRICKDGPVLVKEEIIW